MIQGLEVTGNICWKKLRRFDSFNLDYLFQWLIYGKDKYFSGRREEREKGSEDGPNEKSIDLPELDTHIHQSESVRFKTVSDTNHIVFKLCLMLPILSQTIKFLGLTHSELIIQLKRSRNSMNYAHTLRINYVWATHRHTLIL